MSKNKAIFGKARASRIWKGRGHECCCAMSMWRHKKENSITGTHNHMFSHSERTPCTLLASNACIVRRLQTATLKTINVFGKISKLYCFNLSYEASRVSSTCSTEWEIRVHMLLASGNATLASRDFSRVLFMTFFGSLAYNYHNVYVNVRGLEGVRKMLGSSLFLPV